MTALISDGGATGSLARARPARLRSRASRTGGSLLLLDLAAGTFAAGAIAGASAVPVAVFAACWAVLLVLLSSGAAIARTTFRDVGRGAALVGLVCWIFGPDLGIGSLRLLVATAVLVVISLSGRVARAGDRGLRVLVVADEPDLIAGIEELSAGRLHVVGRCTPRPADVAVRVAAAPVDAVLAVPGGSLAGRSLQRLAWEVEAAGVPLLVTTRLDGVAAARVGPLTAGALGLVEVHWAGRRGWRGLLKRTGDRFVTGLALIAVAPVFAIIAVAVRLDTPGPAIFRQTRVGRNGRQFTMLKFRTMHQNAEALVSGLASEGNDVLFKVRRDPRVTRVGRLLRRYSLDELPQLINVVRGEMSLVGPRPALPAEVEVYDGDPLRRLTVAPGITGLWQVSGRSDLSWAESVRLDLDYVDNWSLGLDVAILLRTFGAVLGHRGAY